MHPVHPIVNNLLLILLLVLCLPTALFFTIESIIEAIKRARD